MWKFRNFLDCNEYVCLNFHIRDRSKNQRPTFKYIFDIFPIHTHTLP